MRPSLSNPPSIPFRQSGFFERYFTPWQVAGNGSLAGTVTGYYEPVLKATAGGRNGPRFPI
ncbi:MltA domain-containing protein [Neisseria gonorrhoeae]|nr:MltA domain-containing protein [Neisseria gonorrhoeae]WLF12936.1 MltA domain-containing protein [Neisseria gonorrhoeae]